MLFPSRKRYSAPTLNTDIDHVYDNQIRADLLSKTIIDCMQHERFDKEIIQNKEDSTTYYVIHPLLKHLAILSLESEYNCYVN